MKNKLTITINGVSFTALEQEGDKCELTLNCESNPKSSIEFTNLENGDRVELTLEPNKH